MRLVEVVEGATRLLVPEVVDGSGPRSRHVPLFYNPVMEFNRDVSVLALKEIAGGSIRKLLDGLAGTGARGVRWANEVAGEGVTYYVNDRNPNAKAAIDDNIALNRLENAISLDRSLNALLAEESFGFIDIDPFGTPVPFLDAAMQAIPRQGFLGVTATDTAPLCGTYPKVCLRRYGVRVPRRPPFYNELGLRVLIGYCVRAAARYDRGARPILAHGSDHYFRIYLSVRSGAAQADESLEGLGHFVFDPGTGERQVGKAGEGYGPIWLGPLCDREFLESLDPSRLVLGSRPRLDKQLALWRQEAGAPPLYYTTDEVAKRARRDPPNLGRMLGLLRESGFRASPTHLDPKGLRTDASMAEIVGLLGGAGECEQ